MDTVLGKHLLGRIPSPEDERDWKLGDFLTTDASLRDQAVAELKQTTVGYKNHYWSQPPSGTHWFKAMAFLAQIAPVTPPAPTPPPSTIWANDEPVLDQGNYGTCVGNGFAQWGNTNPYDDKYTEKDARSIYYEATIIDGSPDDPDKPGGGQQGSTVRAGAKAMQNRKRMGGYAFASTTDEIKTFVLSKGSVTVGTDWMSDMFTPNSKGLVTPTGPVEGGHCYLLLGYDAVTDQFIFLNSWGASWGLDGYFRMKVSDFDKLLQGNGEACAALELAL